MQQQFTIGCDPEVFLTKRGKPVSAYGLLEGTKETPHKTEGGAYQVDGMAAEFNTDPLPLAQGPYSWNNAQFFERWNQAILSQMRQLKEAVPKGVVLKQVPVMEFGKEFLDKQPEKAKELGCDPDYSAYTEQHNPMPDGERTFRSGAGHVHIGWGDGIPVTNKEHISICASFVKQLDATVGMLMTVIDRDPRRRELYGKAGAFRPKPYGVEYRTPSNVWLQTRDTRYAMWRMIQTAITREARELRKLEIIVWDDVGRVIRRDQDYDPQEIINTGDVEKAKLVLARHLNMEMGLYNRIVARADKEAAKNGTDK